MLRRWIGGGLAALLLVGAAASAADLTVSTASSLQNAFVEIGKDFENAHAGSKVLFNFGSSGQLVQQVARGAPADVLATADVDSMDEASQQDLIVSDTRTNFAGNALVLVVPVEARGPVPAIAELGGARFARIALGTPESVPAGAYAKQALELAGQWEALRERCVYGQNVRQVLDYVARGEADVGFVYATDAALMKDKVKASDPIPTQRAIQYAIAAVKGGNEKGAREFIEFVRSEAGQRILAKYGFKAP